MSFSFHLYATEFCTFLSMDVIGSFFSMDVIGSIVTWLNSVNLDSVDACLLSIPVITLPISLPKCKCQVDSLALTCIYAFKINYQRPSVRYMSFVYLKGCHKQFNLVVILYSLLFLQGSKTILYSSWYFCLIYSVDLNLSDKFLFFCARCAIQPFIMTQL